MALPNRCPESFDDAEESQAYAEACYLQATAEATAEYVEAGGFDEYLPNAECPF